MLTWAGMTSAGFTSPTTKSTRQCWRPPDVRRSLATPGDQLVDSGCRAGLRCSLLDRSHYSETGGVNGSSDSKSRSRNILHSMEWRYAHHKRSQGDQPDLPVPHYSLRGRSVSL